MTYLYFLIALMLAAIMVIAYYNHENHKKAQTPLVQTPPVNTTPNMPPLPMEIQAYPKELTDTIGTKKSSFTVEGYEATLLNSPFLARNARVWLIMKNPGLLDMPGVPLGVYKGTLSQLATAERVKDFYNQELVAPKNADQAKNILEEMLRVTYFRDEFGYANNTTVGRGYRVINSINDIEGIVNSVKDVEMNLDITAPTSTTQTDGSYSASLWFWGAHNCRVNHATLTVDAKKIQSITVTNEGNHGTCHGLFYE
jgi:hypothetical protein